MTHDPKNEYTYTSVLDPKSQATNNTAGTAFDTAGYIGNLAMRVKFGIKTAGDNDGTVKVIVQHSDDNTAANATNLSGAANVSTTNNTAAAGTISIDPRVTKRYIFPRIVLTGTNSPAYPVGVDIVGRKQVQP